MATSIGGRSSSAHAGQAGHIFCRGTLRIGLAINLDIHAAVWTHGATLDVATGFAIIAPACNGAVTPAGI